MRPISPKQKAKRSKAASYFHGTRTSVILPKNTKELYSEIISAYRSGYNQAEYDSWFKYSRLAFKELKRFAHRYDLADRGKKK